jgi:hypothetical protein
MNRLSILSGIASLVLPLALHAKEPASQPDKSVYHLFNPVPRELLRELATDRPDKTEGPTTVDAGHVQVEMDIASFSYDRYNSDRTDTRVENWAFGTVNFRFGVLNNLEFDVVLQPWLDSRTRDIPGGVTRLEGFGDIALRAKWNLWGNEGGRTGLALLPFVKLPTNQDELANGEVEGGLIIPFSVDLGDGWGLGMMTQVDVAADSDSRGHHAEWANSITVAYDFTERLGGYVEFFSRVSAEPHTPWIGTVDVGLTYAVTPDIQIDAGMNVGVTRAADDYNPFVGLTWRF